MKVDMSPEAVGERLRIAGELSEELMRSTFEERYQLLLLEQDVMARRALADEEDGTE